MEEKKADLELTSTIHLGVRAAVEPVEIHRLEESLAKLSEEEREIVHNLSRGDAMLVVHRGPSKGSRYLITGPGSSTRIGRDSESEIFLDDVTVSRKHALITENAKSFGLNDLGSLNGTYVNGEPKSSIELKSGDEIQIGKFHMIFFGGNE